MSIKAFRKTGPANEDARKVENNVADYTVQLTKNPILDYIHLKDVAITGSKAIAHGLQRPVQGWIVTRIKSNSVIYETASTDLVLTLAASVPAVVDLYIF